MKPENQDNYFHGWVYRKVIDPALRPIRYRVSKWIPENVNVLDIGCGTGDQLFALQGTIARGMGIDLSSGQIEAARRRCESEGIDNLEFLTADASRLIKLSENEFDYAIASLVLHEMPEGIRLPVLNEMNRVARQLILVDWETRQRNPWRTLSVNSIEFMAGWDHYRGFRSFVRNKGMPALLEAAGLEVDAEQETSTGTMRLWLCH